MDGQEKEEFTEENEREIEITDENADFLYDLYFKKWDAIKSSYDSLISKANFLFMSATGFVYILVLLINKCNNFIDYILSILVVSIYIYIIITSYKAYEPKIFRFDPKYEELCKYYGDKKTFEIKKQIVYNAVEEEVLEKNRKIVFQIAKRVKKGFGCLIVEIVLILILTFTLKKG